MRRDDWGVVVVFVAVLVACGMADGTCSVVVDERHHRVGCGTPPESAP